MEPFERIGSFLVRSFGGEFRLMTASRYRQYAAQCLRILAATQNPQNAVTLRALAIAWNDLAELAKRRASNSNDAEAALGEM
jgi:hypothetical protein